MIAFLSFLILFILLCFIASWWIVKRSTWIKNDGLPENTTAWGRIGFFYSAIGVGFCGNGCFAVYCIRT